MDGLTGIFSKADENRKKQNEAHAQSVCAKSTNKELK